VGVGISDEKNLKISMERKKYSMFSLVDKRYSNNINKWYGEVPNGRRKL